MAQFVTALRRLKDSTKLTQQQVARAAGMAPTTFSGYLNARRLPEEGDLGRLWEVISEDVRQRGGGDVGPHRLDELRALRDSASVCATCLRRGGYAPRPTAAALGMASASDTAERQPARRIVRVRRRRRIRLYGGRRRTIPIPPQHAEVPVPRQEGDRHAGPELTAALAAELRTLRDHHAAGRTRDTHVMLWSKARSISPDEFPPAVAAYRAAGLEEEVETLLRTAAEERDTRAVLNIVAALHDSHQYADAQAVLTVARTDQ
ncbi:helix-turn-helix domain-containing protein [Streptomyces sp. NPDC059618]|uniref:helix-turn-helix domain-containing protein n=1 Tax=Streptomyces sp. NPDC059618 TaxID=3346887 RepID=UPI0036A72639